MLRPELFEAEEVRVEVETAPAALTRGMSIADWKGQWGKEPNCLVVTQCLGRKSGKSGKRWRQ